MDVPARGGCFHDRRVPGLSRLRDSRLRRKYLYCRYDSGLDRGFTDYRDYVLDKLSALRSVHLIDLSLKTLSQIGPALARFLPWDHQYRRK